MAGARRTARQSRFEGFWDRPLPGLLEALGTTPAGLTSDETQRQLRRYGPNALAQESPFAVLIGFLRFFANLFVIILLVASVISITLSDPVGGLICSRWRARREAWARHGRNCGAAATRRRRATADGWRRMTEHLADAVALRYERTRRREGMPWISSSSSSS